MTVTQPDRRRDRGKKLQSTPVKDLSIARGIPVLQPEKLRGDAAFWESLKAAAPDLIIVAAYGGMLPKEVLDLPRLGCVNIHASLLPAYRGAAPIQRAVIDGARETGVTLMYMAEALDAGDIMAAENTEVGEKTSGDLFEELSQMGAALLLGMLPDIEAGRAPRRPQDESRACYAPMIRKEEAHVDFSKDPHAICRLIRGMNPHPAAFARYGDKALKLWEAVPAPLSSPRPAGTVVAVSDAGISVAAGGGAVRITVLQAPGKRPVRAVEYLRGNKIEIGVVLT
jgi:methionyl-tRNA formyltransferase